jgi:hypothetical protein
MLFASLLILSGITVHIYSGSFVVEAGCFIFNVFRVLLGGVRQLVSSRKLGNGPMFQNQSACHHFKNLKYF